VGYKRPIDRRPVTKAVCAFALGVCAWPAVADERYGAPPPDLALYVDRLVRSYPDWIAGADNDNVILKNGARLPISDHRTDKSFDALIEHPDIDDMFYAPYPAESAPKPPAKNTDPGRVRFEPLFAGMYGDCRKNDVVPKLKTIEWLPAHNGGRVAITTVNGVDQALAAVSHALDQLPAEFMKFLLPTAGTYNCRSVAGSSARSMHAYGAAIDINVTYADWTRAPRSGKTGYRPRSCVHSNITASSGVAIGITLTRRISNTDRSCYPTSRCRIETKNGGLAMQADDTKGLAMIFGKLIRALAIAIAIGLAIGLAIGAPTLAQAQQLIGSYVALLSEADHFIL
jgi:hypothetical protein